MNRENGIGPCCAISSRSSAAIDRCACPSASGGGRSIVGWHHHAGLRHSVQDISARQGPRCPNRIPPLVTGAARRIGAAIARRLHEAGDVALHCRASRAERDALAASLEADRPAPSPSMTRRLPVAGPGRATLTRFGRLDALVNNASRSMPRRSTPSPRPNGTTCSPRTRARRCFSPRPPRRRCAKALARSSTCSTSTPNARCPATAPTAWRRPRRRR